MRLAGCRWVRCQPLGGSPGCPRVGAPWYAIPMVTIRLPCWTFFFWEVFFWEGTTGPLKSHHFWETGASESSHIISSDNFHWQVPMPGLIPYFSGKLTMSLCTYFYLACPGTRIEPWFKDRLSMFKFKNIFTQVGLPKINRFTTLTFRVSGEPFAIGCLWGRPQVGQLLPQDAWWQHAFHSVSALEARGNGTGKPLCGHATNMGLEAAEFGQIWIWMQILADFGSFELVQKRWCKQPEWGQLGHWPFFCSQT